MSGVGDAVALQLEKELGAEKAHAIRDAEFGSHHIMSGCPNQK
jgi:hypothetical protein